MAQTGKLQEAMGHWESALRLKPDFAEAHNNLGLALAQTGKLQEAMRHWESALRLKPDFVEVHNNLGNALLASGKTQEAIGHYEQACKLTNNRAAPYLNTLAAAYAAAGRFDNAFTTAQQAIELANSAGQVQVVSEIETRLELYRAGRAYRAPASVTSPHAP